MEAGLLSGVAARESLPVGPSVGGGAGGEDASEDTGLAAEEEVGVAVGEEVTGAGVGDATSVGEGGDATGAGEGVATGGGVEMTGAGDGVAVVVGSDAVVVGGDAAGDCEGDWAKQAVARRAKMRRDWNLEAIAVIVENVMDCDCCDCDCFPSSVVKANELGCEF